MLDLLYRRTGVAAAQVELDAATAELTHETSDAADRYDVALQRWLSLGAADLDARIGVVADQLGIDERLLDQPTATLSGGEAARAGLAALLLSQFDVYLLDEPTNDLDLDGLERLEEWLLGLDAAVLLVSHDRRFLDRVITDVAEIDEFSHRLTLFGGGWQAYLDERELARQHAWERFDEYDTKRRVAGRPWPAATRVGPPGHGQAEAVRRDRQAHPALQEGPDRAAGGQGGPDEARRATGWNRSTSRASRGSSGSTYRMRLAAVTS